MKQYVRRAVALFAAAVLMMGLWVLPTVPTVKAETSTDIVKIACIGASTVFGAGAEDGTSWPSDLQLLLGGLCEVKNFGVNSRTVMRDGTETGDTTQQLAYTLTPQYTDSLAYQADIVLVMLGVNDSKPVNWKNGENTFKEDYEALINAYRGQGNDPLVVFVRDPWVMGESWGITENVVTNEIVPIQKEIAEKYDLPMIDLHTPTKGKTNLYADGVHPNSAGYQVMAETIAAALKGMELIPEGSEDVVCRPVATIGDFYGEYDGYEVMQWKNGTKGSFNYTSGMLAAQMGIEKGTVVKNLTIDLSYYWQYSGGGNDWWHFNTTDKDGLSAPGIANGNAHDNGFGTFAEYGMKQNEWATLSVSRDEQLLGGNGSDWYVNVGDLYSANSLYIRGFTVTATLEDDSVKTLTWGTMKGRRGADDGKTLKIACVGDSLTQGTKGYSYTAFLKLMLGNNCEVKNFGYPGTSVTKGQGLSYIGSSYYTNSLAYQADVVIICIGGNDCQANIWNVGTFQKDYEELIAAYQNQGNDPLVVAMTGGYCQLPDGKNQMIWGHSDQLIEKQVQPAQNAAADKLGIPRADLRAVIKPNADDYIDGDDGVHYTADGYQAMAQLAYDLISPRIDIPGSGDEDSDAMIDPTNLGVSIGDYDGYRCLMWEKGQKSHFGYDSGTLAFALGVESGSVVDLTITLSYFWDYHAGGNDWWHFNTTDKDGLSAPGIANGNPHDNGFGTFTEYGMVGGAWSELVVTREGQMLGSTGGADWTVSVGDLNAANSLYIRGFKVTATLADGTVKEGKWGAYAIKKDLTALEEALESAEIDLSFYTAESVAAFTAARDAAKAVLENELATQAEIDAAAEALVLAQDALEDKSSDTLMGDVNGDGKVNTSDARTVLQYAANIIDADAMDSEAADVDGNGKVNTTDARQILQFSAGIITEFPNA